MWRMSVIEIIGKAGHIQIPSSNRQPCGERRLVMNCRESDVLFLGIFLLSFRYLCYFLFIVGERDIAW